MSSKTPQHIDTVAFLQAVKYIGANAICEQCDTHDEECAELAITGKCNAYNQLRCEIDAELVELAPKMIENAKGGLDVSEIEKIALIKKCEVLAHDDIDDYRTTEKDKTKADIYADSLMNYCAEQAYNFIDEYLGSLDEESLLENVSDEMLAGLQALCEEGEYAFYIGQCLYRESDNVNPANHNSVIEFVTKELVNYSYKIKK
jgi:hypothetical protein